MSPVEAFVTGIKIFDRQESVLDRLIVPKKLLIVDFFCGSKVRSFDFRSSEVTLILSSVLDLILIPVANASIPDIKVTIL